MKSKFLILLLIWFSLSCKHEIENPRWTVELIAPIATTELKLTDMLEDSEVELDTNNNQELLLVYKLSTIDTNLNELISEDNLSFSQSDEIAIPGFYDDIDPIHHKILLGSIISDVPQLDTILIHNSIYQGGIGPTTINGQVSKFDEIEDFDILEIENGKLIIKIKNNLPADIGNSGLGLLFTLSNQDPNNQFPNDDIINISNNGAPITLAQGDSIVIEESLNNALFTDLLELSYQDFNLTPNISTTPIDTTTGIEVEISIKDLIIARIVGEIQNPIPIDSISAETYIDIDGLNVKNANIDSGAINIYLKTPLTMGIQVDFYSPNIIPDEIISITLFQEDTQSINLSGKEVKFDGQYHDTINTFYYELNGFIPAGNIDLDLSNPQNKIEYDISAFVKPESVKADINNISIEIPKDSFEIDFFNDLDIGQNFSIESATITLGIENSLGVGYNYNLNIESENSVSGNTSNINKQGNIGPADLDPAGYVLPTYEDFIFNDLEDIINIKPDLLMIEGIITLEDGIDKFIFYNEGVAVSPNIEVPLSFIASELILSDTTDIELPNEIEDVKLNLIIENGYPINAKIDVYFLDQNYEAIETTSHSMLSGEVNSNGRVSKPTTSVFEISIAQQNIEHIKYIHYLASFETQSQTEYNKIYSDYVIKAQIIAEYKSIIGE